MKKFHQPDSPSSKRIPPRNNGLETEIKISRGISFIGWILLVVLSIPLLIFLLLPLSGLGAISRFFLPILLFLTDEGFFYQQWLGEQGVPSLTDRIIPFVWAVIALLAAGGAGLLPARLIAFDDRDSFAERLFYTLSLGLIAWSVLLFLLSVFGFWKFVGEASCTIVRCLTIGFAILSLLFFLTKKRTFADKKTTDWDKKGAIWLGAFLITFGLLYLLGGLLPTCEYDMLEYHLQGPREIIETGYLGFFPHNIYLNMPSAAEMFHLWGMSLVGHVHGNLIGKTLLVFIGLLVALGCFLEVRRITQSTWGGMVAAVVYLSIPMNFFVFSNGLNDGVIGLGILGAIMLARRMVDCDTLQPLTMNREWGKLFFLLGCYVGFTVGCKYTAVVFVLLPALIFLIFVGRPSKTVPFRTWGGLAQYLICFGSAVGLTGGGWYLKNIWYTGNPFHPLLYSVLGDTTGTWNADKAIRWATAHSPNGWGLSQIYSKWNEFFWTDTMTSPFFIMGLFAIFAILILPKLFRMNDKTNQYLPAGLPFFALMIVLYLVAWFLLTHRILRFLVPVYPLIAIAVSLIFVVLRKKQGKFFSFIYSGVLIIALFYSLFLSSLFQQDWLVSLEKIRQSPTRYGQEAVYFNVNPPKKLLLIGEAKAFAYECPVLYSTCWDDSPLISLLKEGVQYDDQGEKIIAITNAALIQKNFLDAGISHLLVDEQELARFRGAGNYGFTNSEIVPELFDLLEKKGIIRRWDYATKRGTKVYTVLVRPLTSSTKVGGFTTKYTKINTKVFRQKMLTCLV